MKIRAQIWELITQRGYKSYLAFAEEHNLSYHTLRRLDQGTIRYLDIDFFVRLVQALDCSIDELLIIEKESA